ncbi:hypothetical protein EVAR_17870_1 [Eumeta japonica]|uniref:Uncharacterized protein n=1 Tax=Eumeta variegata TaxID=151549 RepID=A0A4C1ZN72_EUMVA|nr:hypothetical protein EVAR_17870_1 [Eumeta japonica]
MREYNLDERNKCRDVDRTALDRREKYLQPSGVCEFQGDAASSPETGNAARIRAHTHRPVNRVFASAVYKPDQQWKGLALGNRLRDHGVPTPGYARRHADAASRRPTSAVGQPPEALLKRCRYLRNAPSVRSLVYAARLSRPGQARARLRSPFVRCGDPRPVFPNVEPTPQQGGN